MAIVERASVTEFFEEIVVDAMKSKGLAASDEARSYVVSLLSELAKPGSGIEQTLGRPLTFLLDEALHTHELGERFDRLRTLGDGVLYSSGFFADHFEARGVDPGYVMSIGRTAYENASSVLRAHRSTGGRSLDLFEELASSFADFVDVIAEVANATVASGAATSKGLVQLYERWRKTGSQRLANVLSSHGFVARPALATPHDGIPHALFDGPLPGSGRGMA